jgi:5-methylthioadenosine/S-adenosylhomocysteine deaminase
MTVRVFHADHVLPGDAPPIADGAVVVGDTGEIIEVGRAGEVVARHPVGGGAVRVRGVVFPGLVNAHTHIELSAMRGRVGGGRGFVGWVDSLVAQRPEVSAEENAEAIDAAIDELARSGTVAVGEVTNSLGAVGALARRGIGGCVFHEVFGQDRATFRRVLREMQARERAVALRALEQRAHGVFVRRVEGVRRGGIREIARRP